MRQWVVLPLLLLFVVGTSAGSSAYALHDLFDSILYGPKGRGLFCYVGEPRDLAGYQHRSDGIFRVRLGARFRERVLLDGRTETWDVRDAIVLDTFKTTDAQPVAGEKIRLVEWRGWTAPRAGILTILLTPVEALLPPTEWIVFAAWAQWFEAYEVLLRDEGAFQIRDGTIRMRTESSWGMKWDGKPESVLLEQLR